jgi:hypothetical protein
MLVFKVLLCLCAAVFGLLVALVLAWAVYNWIDEAPSSAAAALSLKAPTVPDADNAWVHWMGMGAAVGADPVQGARSFMNAHAGDPAQVWADPLPVVKPTQDVHGFDSLCGRTSSCLEHVSQHQAGYRRLNLDNAPRLQRLRAMLVLREWQPIAPPRLAMPAPTAVDTNRLYADGLALRWLEAASAGDCEQVLAEVQDFAEFWAHIATRPDQIFSAMVAATSIERAQRIVADVATTLDHDALQRHAPALQAILAITPTINWRTAVAGEHQIFMDAVTRQPMGLYRLGFAPQSTFNAHAELSLAMADFLAAAPGDRGAARQRLAATSERYMPPLGEASRIPGYFAYNPVGKIIVALSIPTLPYGDRVADMEAMRRMRMLMLLARLENARAGTMSAFLNRHSPALADPVTLIPFAWDADTQAISYRPLQPEHWEEEILRQRVPLQ